MTGWVILVDQGRDLPNAETPHKVISTGEYLARPRLFDMGRPKIVNLARSYAYQVLILDKLARFGVSVAFTDAPPWTRTTRRPGCSPRCRA